MNIFPIRNPIRMFAVLCVTVISGFVMFMSYRLLQTLSGPGWCATALGAGKASSQDGTPIKGLEACVGLLTIQLKSLANNSYIFGGVIALCLLTLIVIVIAGARLDFKVSPTGGVETNIDRSDAVPVTVTNLPTDPVPTAPVAPPPPTGPAMPEPQP